MTLTITIELDGIAAPMIEQLRAPMYALGFVPKDDSARLRLNHEADLTAIAAAQAGDDVGTTAPEPKPETTTAAKPAAKKKVAPAISATPEDRRPPEDDAQTQAQDEQDEAAEVERNRKADKPLTTADVNLQIVEHVKASDVPTTQAAGAAIFVKALGAPPAGEEGWKLTMLTTQEQIKKAHDAWADAVKALIAAKGV